MKTLIFLTLLSLFGIMNVMAQQNANRYSPETRVPSPAPMNNRPVNNGMMIDRNGTGSLTNTITTATSTTNTWTATSTATPMRN